MSRLWLATAARPQVSGEEVKIGGYYRAFIDEARLKALDAAPMKAELNEIRAVRTREDLARLQGASHGRFGVTLIGYGVYDDAKNPKFATADISLGGLGPSDRDFYQKPDFVERKVKHQVYVAQWSPTRPRSPKPCLAPEDRIRIW